MNRTASHPDIDAGPDATTELESLTSSPRWMQASGAIVFISVLVLLSWLLPPLFDTDAGSTGGGGHMPPAGGHGPPTTGSG